MRRTLTVMFLAAAYALGADRMPLVLDGKIPQYPPIAVAARVAGEVVVKFAVVDGVVADAQIVRSDSQLLNGSTLDNVRSWRFDTSTNAQLETEFEYEIGPEAELIIPQNPTVELRLPRHVRLIANPVKRVTLRDPSGQRVKK